MPAAQSAIRWVAHPLTIAAALVLLVNDHVLKAAFPGLITGKLSDVAGLAAAPALVALAVGLVVPRLPSPVLAGVALGATGAGFAWTKASAAGAEAASAVWSAVAGPSVVLADASDLLALPALGLAWWAWRRGRSTEPVGAPTVLRARLFVALPLVALATAATSAVPVNAVLAVESEGEGIALYTPYGVTRGTPAGGWSPIADVPPDASGRTNAEATARSLENSTACVPDSPAHCYRLHTGDALGVDETVDGGASWSVSWEIPPERWRWLLVRHDLGNAYGTPHTGLLTATDILVRAVPGGHEVVVAAGVEGLVVRSADGSWERVAVAASGGEAGPSRFHAGPYALSEFGAGIRTELGLAVLVGVLALLLGTVTGGIVGRRSERVTSFVWSGVTAGLLALGVPLLGIANWMGNVVWVGLLALALAIAHTVFVLRGRALTRGRASVLAATMLVPTAAFALPFLGWSVARPSSYTTAAVIALVATGVAVVAVVPVAVRLHRTTAPGPRPRRPGQW